MSVVTVLLIPIEALLPIVFDKIENSLGDPSIRLALRLTLGKSISTELMIKVGRGRLVGDRLGKLML